MAATETRRTTPCSAAIPLAALSGLLGLALVALRPVSPFEWDEVLFMRGAEHYDASHGAPHAPGYPAYAFLTGFVRFLLHDPQLATQLVTIGFAVALPAALWSLGRRLRASAVAVVAAAGALVVTPAFAFNANVGLSDVPGAVLGVAAMAALLAAWDEPRRTWVGAAVTAVAIGARPQVIAALLPVGAALLVRLLTTRRYRDFVLGMASGTVASALVWVPALLLTGPAKFLAACRRVSQYTKIVEVGTRLPGARLDPAADHWLQRPFGAPFAAGVFWAMVLVGCVLWWRAGRKRLVAVAGSAVVSYYVIGSWTLNYTTAVRYALPALPFAALLAAGCLAARRRGGRVTAGVALGLWMVGEVIWGMPVYLLRREPAPVWSTLQWVASHYDPRRTTVVYPERFAPHAEWIFRRAGFAIVKAVPGAVYDASLRPDGAVLVLSTWPVPGTTIVHRDQWRNGRLVRLTRDRYYDCTAAVAAAAVGPAYSPAFEVRDQHWVLWDSGSVRLGPDAAPRLLRVTPGDVMLYVRAAGWSRLKVERGETREVLLAPGPAGAVTVSAPRRARVELPPLEVQAVTSAKEGGPIADAYVVPIAAHRPGLDGAAWRTDLWLYNPGPAPILLDARFLPTAVDNVTAPVRRLALPPGAPVQLADVLARADLVSGASSGALVLTGSKSAGSKPAGSLFVVEARTYDARFKGRPDTVAETLPGVPLAWGLLPGGEARFNDLAGGGETRTQVGLVSLCEQPVEARLDYLDFDGRDVATQRVDVPVFGHVQVPARVAGANLVLRVTSIGSPSACRLFPYVSRVDAGAHAVRDLLPDVLLAPPGGATEPIPMPPEGPARAGGRSRVADRGPYAR